MSRMPKKYCDFAYDKAITRWDEGLPLGNGRMGCLIWGEGKELRCSLDCSELWDVTPYPGVQEPDFTYKKLVELVGAGNQQAIRDIFDLPYSHPTPTKLPAGKLLFSIRDAKGVRSSLDIARAEAAVTVETAGGQVQLRAYLHAVRPIGWIRVTAPEGSFQLRLENPAFGQEGDSDDQKAAPGTLAQLKYPPAQHGEGESMVWFRQPVKDGFYYGIVLGWQRNGDTTELAYQIFCGREESCLPRAQSEIKAALAEGYQASLQAHCDWWRQYWEQSALELPDALYQREWYRANYLFASCSRKGCLPMPLQGVWTADDGCLPPWKGDYHHDLNTQMSYYHYLKANHLPEGEAFLDFLWNLAPVARQFAAGFYGSTGLCLPAVMAVDGTPLGGWPMYSLSPTNQLWLCQAFERYYRFTGDRKLLEERIYPYLAESMQCVQGLLISNEAGQYELPVSSSSEIHDDKLEAWLKPNSNYDLSLMRYVAGQLISMAETLDNGEAAQWQRLLEKLPPLAINREQVLMLNPLESLLESHRHFSHAMAIHPLRLLDSSTPEERGIIDATIHNLEVLGSGYWVGFSFAWMAELYAVQKNGEGAAYQLKLFWENCCSPNGFHLNGDYKKRGISQFHYRPFTLEANLCAADALQEMLLQTENGTIQLFPAIPEDWRKGTTAFTDFRGEGGILISARMVDGQMEALALKPTQDGVYRLEYPGTARLVAAPGSAVAELSPAGQGAGFLLGLVGGGHYWFQFLG